MKITRTAALALFAALGMPNADKWNPKRMAGKLAKVDEMVDANTKLEDKAADKTLTLVLKAITADEDIEVEVEATPAPKGKKGAAPEVPPAKGAVDLKAEKAKKEKEAKATKDAATAAKKETAKAAAKAKADKAAADKAARTPGVREIRSRPYLAGMLIAKYGLAAGVTDAMATELDTLYGKENPIMSKWCLSNAHHTLRGAADQKAAKK